MIMICVELGIPESMLPTIVNVLSIPLLKAIYTHVAQTVLSLPLSLFLSLSQPLYMHYNIYK